MPLLHELCSAPSVTILLGLLACTTEEAPPPQPAEPAKAGTPATKPASERPDALRSNLAWWPDQVDLSPLRRNAAGNPYGAGQDYAAAFAKLDLAAVKADIAKTMTTSQDL